MNSTVAERRSGTPALQVLLDACLLHTLSGCLPATNIRFLDNQWNMAKELFDGHIVTEITLGEAIARGILKPLKFVLSVYFVQKNLEKYEGRVEKLRNPATYTRSKDF